MNAIRLDDGSLGEHPLLTDVLQTAYSHVDVTKALHYPPPQGDPALRATLQSVFTLPDQTIQITGSATEALHLAFNTLKNKKFCVQSPAYFGVWRQLKALGIEFETWEDIQQLERITNSTRFDVYYVSSTCSPLHGMAMRREEQELLLEQATQNNALIIEDNPCDLLHYHSPAMRIVDTYPNTLYTSSVSKILAPGLRLGFIAGSAENLKPVRSAKITSSLSSSALDQQLVYHALQQNYLPDLAADFYDRWTNAKRALLARDLTSFTDVQRGIFTALELPKIVNIPQLIQHCLDRGVQFEENKYYYPDAKNRNWVRINFVRNSTAQTCQAINTLADVLDELHLQPSSDAFSGVQNILVSSPPEWIENVNVTSYAARQAESCVYLERVLPVLQQKARLCNMNIEPLTQELLAVHACQYQQLDGANTVVETERNSYYFDSMYAELGVGQPVEEQDKPMDSESLLTTLLIHGVSYLRGAERYKQLAQLHTSENEPYQAIWTDFNGDADGNWLLVQTFCVQEFGIPAVRRTLTQVLQAEQKVMESIWQHQSLTPSPHE